MSHRLTISLDDETAGALDAFMRARRYANRSEAVRDLLRAGLAENAAGQVAHGECLAAVSYIYDHHERELGRRLLQAGHDHHALGVATLHAHIDQHHCAEVALLRGPARQVRRFAEAMVAERGVKLGHANVMPLGAPHRRR